MRKEKEKFLYCIVNACLTFICPIGVNFIIDLISNNDVLSASFWKTLEDTFRAGVVSFLFVTTQPESLLFYLTACGAAGNFKARH